MPGSASITGQTVYAAHSRPWRGPMISHLWRAIRGDRQRRLDRVTAQAVRALGHAGVSEDYRMASQRR